MRLSAGLTALMLACACGPQPAPPQASSPPAGEAAENPEIAEGRAIAERECAQCHGLDETGLSPRAEAPPMRELLGRYNEEALATDLIEGIKMGHEDMPLFDFNVIAADALIAYLNSIRPVSE